MCLGNLTGWCTFLHGYYREAHKEAHVAVGDESTEEFLSSQDRLGQFVKNNLFGADDLLRHEKQLLENLR